MGAVVWRAHRVELLNNDELAAIEAALERMAPADRALFRTACATGLAASTTQACHAGC
jgi:hypothetical protein